MNKETLKLYKYYFKSNENFKIFFEELQAHDSCFFCKCKGKSTKLFCVITQLMT